MAGTEERILDATFEVLSRVGIAALSLEDVARAAGMSRQTLYRYFGNRDALIAATVLREEQGFLLRIQAAVTPDQDLRAALVAGTTAAMEAARDHPLLDRLLASEPESLLPFLTTGAGPVLNAARPALYDMVAARVPALSEERVHALADAYTRLIVSYAINPPDEPVALVAGVLADMFTAGILEADRRQSATPTSIA